MRLGTHRNAKPDVQFCSRCHKQPRARTESLPPPTPHQLHPDNCKVQSSLPASPFLLRSGYIAELHRVDPKCWVHTRLSTPGEPHLEGAPPAAPLGQVECPAKQAASRRRNRKWHVSAMIHGPANSPRKLQQLGDFVFPDESLRPLSPLTRNAVSAHLRYGCCLCACCGAWLGHALGSMRIPLELHKNQNAKQQLRCPFSGVLSLSARERTGAA